MFGGGTIGTARPLRALPALALAAVLTLLATPAAAGAASGALYKIEFNGTGTEHVTDSDGGGYSLDQHASWTLKPETTELWLPRLSAPPGPGNELKIEATGPDHLNPSGEVTETGTYAEDPSPASYRCSGPLENNVGMRDTAEVGPLTTVVGLTGDFFGTFSAGVSGAFGNQGGEFGNPNAVGSCNTDPEKGYETQGGYFSYFWDPEMPEEEVNQRMEVGAQIPPQDIGLPNFGLVATDFSNVHQSSACEYNAPGSGCTVEFALNGSWDLTKVCEGTLSGSGTGAAAGSCAGGEKGQEKKEKAKEKAKEKGAGKEKGKEKGKGNSKSGGKNGGSKEGKLSLTSASAQKSGVKATLKCKGPAGVSCKASTKITAGKTTVGQKSASVGGGKTSTVTISLNRAGKRLLAKASKLEVKLEVAQSEGGKSHSVAARKLTLTPG